MSSLRAHLASTDRRAEPAFLLCDAAAVPAAVGSRSMAGAALSRHPAPMALGYAWRETHDFPRSAGYLPNHPQSLPQLLWPVLDANYSGPLSTQWQVDWQQSNLAKQVKCIVPGEQSVVRKNVREISTNKLLHSWA